MGEGRVRALFLELGRTRKDENGPPMAREPVFRGKDREASARAAGEDASGTVPVPESAANTPREESRYDDELRPQSLTDVVGQQKVLTRLKITLDAAKMRNEPLGHLLLDGPPGLGKTTLATVIPRELGTDLQITSGPSLSAPKDLLPYLTNASHGSVLFIDEIHRMPAAVEEYIYPAMEDFRVDITLGEGLNARTVNIKLQRFTVIGATTRSGLLTGPLRDRFVNREHLDFYSVDEIAEIVRRSARKLRTEISEPAVDEIAKRSRGTPRKANNLLRWARDYAQSRADGHITPEASRDAFHLQEIDDLGLEAQDRRYLTTLVHSFGGGPAGVSALGHSLNIPTDTLEDEIEPFLLRIGFLLRTPRGRMITANALAHLALTLPKPRDDQGRLF
jgi:Holliday junction DNA helicase RuvB